MHMGYQCHQALTLSEHRKEAPVIRLGGRTALRLIIATLIVGIMGMRAYPQHSNGDSETVSGDPVWSDLQHRMQVTHEAMSSLKPTCNNDVDFVRLMVPHHRAALDVAKVELMYGQDPQMRGLAQEIITDQESEIELMQLWLEQQHAQESKRATSTVKEQISWKKH